MNTNLPEKSIGVEAREVLLSLYQAKTIGQICLLSLWLREAELCDFEANLCFSSLGLKLSDLFSESWKEQHQETFPESQQEFCFQSPSSQLKRYPKEGRAV